MGIFSWPGSGPEIFFVRVGYGRKNSGTIVFGSKNFSGHMISSGNQLGRIFFGNLMWDCCHPLSVSGRVRLGRGRACGCWADPGPDIVPEPSSLSGTNG